MKYKRIILVALISSSILGIFGCIDCGDHLSYQEIKDINSTLWSNDFVLIEDQTDLDSLNVSLQFDINFIACQKKSPLMGEEFSLPLINSSYAWSCDENGELGMKDKIVDFKFYSTVDYLDIPSGSAIILENSQALSDVELIDLLNDYLIDFRVQLVKKQIGYFDLYVSFEFDSGIAQDFELASFIWE